ncbi:MAG: Flp pilus assembly protein CpaB [Frankiaceae bacterium]|nr:Flp pilus assembly protein CpaB [Frankiaceae bacterium]
MLISLVRRLAAEPRRFAAVVCLGLAVLCALQVLRPQAPPTRSVWVVAHDVDGGAPLTAHDVRPERLPLRMVPRGALLVRERVVGRLVAAPMRAGEPVTDVRLLEPSLLAALPQPGLVAVPIRLADGAAAAALTRAGDLVNVLATAADDSGAAPPAGSGPATQVIAAKLTVLAVPARDTGSDDGGAGLVVVAATDAQAARLAGAAATTRLSLVLLRR